MGKKHVTVQKTFVVNDSQSQHHDGKIRLGKLEGPNGYSIPAMGFLLDNPADETAMKELQEFIPTSRCYIRPDWVQKGLAIFRRATPWNPYNHLKGNVAVPLDVPLRQPPAKHKPPAKLRPPAKHRPRAKPKPRAKPTQPRRVWTTSSKVNDMIRELLSFFSDLHDQGFALDDFQPTDFVVVENDHVPKLWRTELVSGKHFEVFRRRNFVNLGSFLKDYLERHFEHQDFPWHTKNFLDMLMQVEDKTTDELKEHVEYLKVHVQVLGFGRTIHAFKSILDWSKGISERLKANPQDSMGIECLSLLKEFDEHAIIDQLPDGRRMSRWLAHIENNQHTLIKTVNASLDPYCNSVEDLFLCIRNFLTHMSDHSEHSHAAMLYLVIEDMFPGLICQFFNAIQKYPTLRDRSRKEFSY